MSEGGGADRPYGALDASAIVIGSMVGAGVFTTSGFALSDLGAGRWVLLAWGVGGIVALCGALSYGGLVTRIPRSGGEYTFLSEALHPVAGFLAGWVSLLAGFTGPIAAAALVFAVYTNRAFAAELPERLTASALIAAVGLLHGLRVRAGAANLNAAVGLKLLALAVFIGWATVRIRTGSAPTAFSGGAPFELGPFAVTLVWISFSYSGWNGAVYMASEIRDPERNLVRALWISTVGVSLLYVALNAVFLGGAPAGALAGRPDVAAVAAGHLGGPWLARGVAAVVGLALFTSVSAMMAAGPRVYLQMARDGFLPRGLGLARAAEAPTRVVAFQAALALVVVWISDIATLIATLGFVLSLSAALAVATACRLRLREGPVAVPIPLFPWTPLLYMTATLGGAGFMIARAPRDAAIALAIVASGLALYAVRRAQRRGGV